MGSHQIGVDIMNVGWVLWVGAAWVVVAVAVGLLLGQMIRRNRHDDPEPPDWLNDK